MILERIPPRAGPRTGQKLSAVSKRIISLHRCLVEELLVFGIMNTPPFFNSQAVSDNVDCNRSNLGIWAWSEFVGLPGRDSPE